MGSGSGGSAWATPALVAGYRADITRTLTAAVHREDDLYVARALEVEVASQGATIEDALAALRETLELYFEDEGAFIDLAHPLVTTLQIGEAV